MENAKKTCLFLRALEFSSTFDIQISIALAIFWEAFPKGSSQNKIVALLEIFHLPYS